MSKVTRHKLKESWLTVVIETRGNDKFVTIESTIHVTKSLLLPHSYSTSWSDAEILRDRDFIKYYVRFL